MPLSFDRALKELARRRLSFDSDAAQRLLSRADSPILASPPELATPDRDFSNLGLLGVLDPTETLAPAGRLLSSGPQEALPQQTELDIPEGALFELTRQRLAGQPAPPALPPEQGPPPVSPEPDLGGGFQAAISGQESGGDDAALGPSITSGALRGERAIGRFQIMPSTFRLVAARLPGVGDGLEAATDQELQQAMLDDPDLQLRTFNGLTALNAQDLDTTDPVALGLAHYGGLGPARRYLETGDISDEPQRTVGGQEFPSHLQYVRGILERLGPEADQPMAGSVDELVANLIGGVE